MISNTYSITKVFFTFGDHVLRSGRVDIDYDPKEWTVFSTEDRDLPTVSDIDIATVQYLFNIEVTMNSYCCNILDRLVYEQYYIHRHNGDAAFKYLVFNDYMGTKVISNFAKFSGPPERGYGKEAEKLTFSIKAMNCQVEKPCYLLPITKEVRDGWQTARRST